MHCCWGGLHAWLVGGMHGWWGGMCGWWGACMVVGGMHGCQGGVHGCGGRACLPGACVGYDEIRSMSVLKN